MTEILFEEAYKLFLTYLRSLDRSEETINSYRKDYEHFKRFYEYKHNCMAYIEDIEEDDVEYYLVYQKDKNLSPATRSRTLYALRSLYSFATKREFCKKDITSFIQPIKLPQKERIFLSPEEVDAIIKNTDNIIIRIILFTLYHTGLRISECLNLTIENVDLEKRVIHVIAGKGNKDRDVPISDILHDVLTNYLYNIRNNKSEYFFSANGNNKISYKTINYHIKKATRKAGINKNVSCHIFRHSFASNIIKNGGNIVVLQKLLGHSSLKITSIYTHSDFNDLKNTVNLVKDTEDLNLDNSNDFHENLLEN